MSQSETALDSISRSLALV